MSRMIDRMRRGEYKQPGFWDRRDAPEALRRFEAQIWGYLDQATRIVADNVAAYFYDQAFKEAWNIESDFPCLASPFEQCWIEWGQRQAAAREFEDDPNFLAHVRGCGVLVSCWPRQPATRGKMRRPERFEDCRWELSLQSYVEDGGRWSGPLWWSIHCLSGQGEVLDTIQHSLYNVRTPTETHRDIEMGCGICMVPAYLALCFLNCKNVTLREEAPPEKLSRAHEKRHGKPLTRYHVLDIEPMKQVLRTEGESEKTGLKKALHICRGHFADYREGQGLFGKYHGRYWVPMHARGAIGEGVVAKDYAVKAPRKEERS
jgi:hypothetical protein